MTNSFWFSFCDTRTQIPRYYIRLPYCIQNQSWLKIDFNFIISFIRKGLYTKGQIKDCCRLLFLPFCIDAQVDHLLACIINELPLFTIIKSFKKKLLTIWQFVTWKPWNHETIVTNCTKNFFLWFSSLSFKAHIELTFQSLIICASP